LGAHRSRLTGGGPAGNELLTSVTGTALIVLLAVIGVTLLRLRPLLSVHLFVGMLLVGPVALKLASTGYRFARYYTHDAVYRRKGPPPTTLRMIAPIVVLSTVVVFASGVALLFIGPSSRGALLPVHKIAFIVWAAFTALHVLAHLTELPRALRADYSRRLGADPSGRDGRVLALAGAIVLGAVLAILTIPQFAPWLHAHFFHHHG
jgi:hypothetical protein